MPNATPPQDESPVVVTASPADPLDIYGQLLAEIRSLRGDVGDLRTKMETVATRNDLKDLVPTAVFTEFRNGVDGRFHDQGTHIQRVEDRTTQVSDDLHNAEVGGFKRRETSQSDISNRRVAILVCFCSLVLAPIIDAIFSQILKGR